MSAEVATRERLGRVLDQVAEKVRRHRERPVFPQYSTPAGWRTTDPRERRPGFMPEDAAWTVGFWPGMLWIASDVLGNPRLATQARSLTRLLEQRAEDDRTHDLGFVFMPSCVLGFSVDRDAALRDTAVRAARTLVQRWDRRGGYLRAWGEPGSSEQRGLTTIDALMNAAFVLWMARVEGSQEVEELARRHADNARQHQLRPDGSTAQVAAYDPSHGRFLRQDTHQGLSPESCWSRGQAWAIYGFALFASITGDASYQDAGVRAADYFWKHLPDDALPPWDFADAESGIVDSSALAIACAGFLCLAGLPGLSRYRQRAGHMLERLAALAVIDDGEEPGLLAHGTFSRRLGVGIDASLIFGDFYFMEALGRYLGLPHADFLRPGR